MIRVLLFVLFAAVSVKPCGEDKILQSLYQESEIVIIAKVIEVKPSDLPAEMWSGPVAVTQQVKYEVMKVLKGKIVGKEILVRHYVVKNSKTADKNRARLSPKLFKKGNSLILFMKNEGERSDQPSYLVFGENCGAVIADAKMIKKIERLSVNKQE